MAKVKHYKKTYGKRGKTLSRVFFVFQIGALGVLLGCIALLGLFIYYAKDLPRPERFSEFALARPTKIYDRTGTVLLHEIFGEEKREVLPLSEIPDILKQAIVATEDAGFYSHIGVSLRGTARAILSNLGLRSSQTGLQGGSTITQQLARTSFLSREKTTSRKIRELVLTIELERRYSKNQILEFYLNQIPFGSNAYGVGTASQLYFGKVPENLTLAEAASLAALIQAPSYYSPYGEHKDSLLARKDYVLNRMIAVGYISKEQAEESRKQEVVFQEINPPLKSPHFVFYVTEYLFRSYGENFLRENGLRVLTTLDWNLQQIAEQAIKEGAERNKASHAHNAALVALNPNTGEILAMVGSKDWFAPPFPEHCTPGKDCLFDPKVNITTFNKGRQPGSAFKPFAYATAFKKGYTDQTTVVDEETNFGVWGGKEYIPKNYDGTFHGTVTLRQALAQSLNIPSIKVLLDFAGISDSIATAEDMGITTLQDPSFYGPALVLGGGEVRLLELASAYGVFATEGKRIPASAILEIRAVDGRVIEKNTNTPIQILSHTIARMITDILADNEARLPVFSPTSPLFIPGHRVAVKTGTTQEYRDGWSIGYTKNLVIGVWAGNNNNEPTNREPGVALASPIWNRVMTQALLNKMYQ